MKIFLILLLLIVLSNCVKSQTIINAESLTGSKDSTILAASISYTGNRGNLKTNQIDISPSFLMLRPHNEFKVFGSYNMLSQSGNKLLNSAYIHLRHNYRITNKIKTFEFYQIQFNEILILQKRELYGVGFRFDFIEKDSLKTRFSFGIMREKEELDPTKLQLNEIVNSDYFRLNNILSFKYIFSKNFTVDNVFYYQPYFKDFSDYRILNDIRFSSKISEHLALIITLNIRYDSAPPIILEKTDYSFNFGLNIKF